MGYYSRLHGRISIKPPLSPEEISDNPVDYFEIDEDGSGISFDSDEGKYYYLQDNMLEFVSKYSTHFFSGAIEVFGEDSTDIWRLRVESQIKEIEVIVSREEAVTRWPDGTEVRSIY